MPENEMVTISEEDLNELKADSFFLECLECCGVDNWQGYDEARMMFAESFRQMMNGG